MATFLEERKNRKSGRKINQKRKRKKLIKKNRKSGRKGKNWKWKKLK